MLKLCVKSRMSTLETRRYVNYLNMVTERVEIHKTVNIH